MAGASVPAVDDERCAGITQTGLQCRRPGNPWCYQHRPPTKALNFDATADGDDAQPAEDQDALFPVRERR